jgi:protein TonB
MFLGLKGNLGREPGVVSLFQRKEHEPESALFREPKSRALEPRYRSKVVELNIPRATTRDNGASSRLASCPAFKIGNVTGPTKGATRKLIIAAAAVSIALHSGIIASMMMADSGEQFGTLADRSDTFSLSLEQSVVLESTSDERVQMASASAAASQVGSVQAVESKPQEIAQAESDPASDDPPPKPIEVADVTPAALAPVDDWLAVVRGGGAEQDVSEIKAEQIAETEVKEMPDVEQTKEDTPAKAVKKKAVEKEEQVPQKESHQQVAGSSTSRANASHVAANGRVSASRGNALSYGAMVRAQLARNKPMGNGLRGTVQVSFGIGNDGNIRYVRVSQSSGSAMLDDTALAAIRKSAPFEQPPADLTPGQLAYVIPFYFR